MAREECLVLEWDVDALFGPQENLRSRAIVLQVKHLCLQWSGGLRQVLEIPPLLNLHYDTADKEWKKKERACSLSGAFIQFVFILFYICWQGKNSELSVSWGKVSSQILKERNNTYWIRGIKKHHFLFHSEKKNHAQIYEGKGCFRHQSLYLRLL